MECLQDMMSRLIENKTNEMFTRYDVPSDRELNQWNFLQDVMSRLTEN